MLLFLMSFFPFAHLPSKPLPPLAGELRLLPLLLWQQLLSPLRHFLDKCRSVTARDVAASPSAMSSSKSKSAPAEASAEESRALSVLDLPELALECILGKLSPAGLGSMAVVCSALRERCRSDHLWEKHMKEKWGKVVGHAAGREWKLYSASMAAKASSTGFPGASNLIRLLSCVCPITWLKSRIGGGCKVKSYSPDGSVMSWYQSLESGKFRFPAQVYNREVCVLLDYCIPTTRQSEIQLFINGCGGFLTKERPLHGLFLYGHVGFMLSCYDAEVSYDSGTDTFHARYPPHGWRTIVTEEGVEWSRLRAPPVSTCAHELHISGCLSDLLPGDHIEIQWRRNKEFPYGWWYGVIGHLESCGGNEHFCRCHLSNIVVLEFSQYTPGSRWRQTFINRKDHREEGNETDGFYGGIRKLQSKDEISKWRELWPTDVLE